MKHHLLRLNLLVGAVLLLLTACSEQVPKPAAVEPPPANTPAPVIERNPIKNVYFGDVHVHTRFSFDAYLFGTRATPDDAYRFAKGEALAHATGFVMQMKKPLDFQAVTDHAFYLGTMPAMSEGEGPLSQHPLAEVARNITTGADSRNAFAAAVGHLRSVGANPDAGDPLDDHVIRANTWQEIVASANRHNDPGTFTALVGYEYTTSGPANENLHRNVIFRGDRVPELPFSRLESRDPEDLWRWMDEQRADGMELLAIPHNSNASDGMMFDTVRFDGSAIDASYAELRIRNEPLAENTQVKGTSDTHPLLSPNDEWANFEIMPIKVASPQLSEPPGSYVRDAYHRGLAMAEEQGYNPYKFGVIGSSDTHNAAGSFEEDNYWSKTGVSDITAEQRGSVPLDPAVGDEVPDNDPLSSGESGIAPDGRQYATAASRYWGASGLAAVWAESNTRADIYDAFARKETFSTSGPHIKVRFFGSQSFTDDMLTEDDIIARAYADGVPMGGDLIGAGDTAPRFFVWAASDPDTVGLQRIQIVKGSLKEGVASERLYDVACSDGGAVDPQTHRCPDNGAKVDLQSCTPTAGKGAGELRALWQDPDFDPAARAFFYVRVLENPKCRWSTWDAIRSEVAPRLDMETTIQDRAWSSPIWYTP